MRWRERGHACCRLPALPASLHCSFPCPHLQRSRAASPHLQALLHWENLLNGGNGNGGRLGAARVRRLHHPPARVPLQQGRVEKG